MIFQKRYSVYIGMEYEVYKVSNRLTFVRGRRRRYTSQTKNVYKLWRLHEKEKCVTFNFITYDNLWARPGARLKNMLLRDFISITC